MNIETPSLGPIFDMSEISANVKCAAWAVKEEVESR